MNPKIILTFALSLCACGPGLAIDYGDTGPWDDDAGDADSGGSETGVPVDMGGDVDPCHDEFVYECDLDGRCWATRAGWSAWAQYADPALVDLAVFGGAMIKTVDFLGIDGECYDIAGTDAHMCVVTFDCVPLWTRPLTEVAIGPSDCLPDGPWTAADTGVDSTCWGQLSTVAVELRP